MAETRIAPAVIRGESCDQVRTGSRLTVGDQLRARRDAWLRMPPLESGHRDPYGPAPMRDAEARHLANELHRMGFATDYLTNRYELTARA